MLNLHVALTCRALGDMRDIYIYIYGTQKIGIHRDYKL